MNQEKNLRIPLTKEEYFEALRIKAVAKCGTWKELFLKAIRGLSNENTYG